MLEAEAKLVPPMTVAYLPMRGSFSQMTAGFDTLFFLAGASQYNIVGAPMAVILANPESGEGDAVWELWVPISDTGVELTPDASRLGVKKVPETLVASTMHTGAFSEMGSTYDSLAGWMAENGYTQCGPPQEVYLSDPEQVREAEYLTEIRVPVQAG